MPSDLDRPARTDRWMGRPIDTAHQRLAIEEAKAAAGVRGVDLRLGTSDELLVDYPDLECDDVLAAPEFAALAVGRVVPLSAA